MICKNLKKFSVLFLAVLSMNFGKILNIEKCVLFNDFFFKEMIETNFQSWKRILYVVLFSVNDFPNFTNFKQFFSVE